MAEGECLALSAFTGQKLKCLHLSYIELTLKINTFAFTPYPEKPKGTGTNHNLIIYEEENRIRDLP